MDKPELKRGQGRTIAPAATRKGGSGAQRPTGPIVIAAGGTGGHLFPAQALAEDLVARGHRLVLVTDERGKTYTDAFPDTDIRMVNAATFAGRGLAGKVVASGSIVSGIAEAYKLLGQLRPAAVVGFGGYPAFPAMVGAALRRYPVCIHEQNAVLGRVNRAVASYVTTIACAFDELQRVPRSARDRVVVTGNPVREPIRARRGDPYLPPVDGGPIRLLIIGGSQGARVLGKVVPDALIALDPGLRSRLRIVQQVREEDLAEVRGKYAAAGIEAETSPFFTDMAQRLSNTHLVITRAGASSVTELMVVGRPALLVPLPSAMDDHQTVNAQVLERAGGGWLLPEKTLTAEDLAARLTQILKDPDLLAEAAEKARCQGRPDATTVLGDLIHGLAVQRTGALSEAVAGQAV